MLEENKNLKSHIKDTSHNLYIKDDKSPVSYKTESFLLGSYTKVNKLISALYMVTDIMDTDEPLRKKLRNSGTSIISDIYLIDKGQAKYNQIHNRVSEVLSFIEIASSVGIISDMNSNILMKEFNELRKSIIESNSTKEENWLEEFINESGEELNFYPTSSLLKGRMKEGIFNPKENSIGHGTRIGVQKGSTLLHALSRVEVSDKIPHLRTSRIKIERNFSGSHLEAKHQVHNDVLKNKRREEIILVIKDKMKSSVNFEGVTITDIKSNGHEMIASCGEKTLQRELVSMVLDGILKKTGEKRWSKYSIKN
jgi:hypothetical protein